MSANDNPPLHELNAHLFAALLPETHGEKPKKTRRTAAEDTPPTETAPTDTE